MRRIIVRHYVLRVLPLIFVLLLAGCATPWVWQHPQGLGKQELEQATNECLDLAWQEANSRDYYTPYYYPYYPYYDRYYYRHSPYYYDYPPPIFYDSQRRLYDEQRFFRICMHAKGWRQVPVTPSR